jgi:hypothetical protein
VLGFRGGYSELDPANEAEPVKITPQFVDGIHQKGGTILSSTRGPASAPRRRILSRNRKQEGPRARKTGLAAPKDPLRLSPLFHAQSEQVLEAVRELGLEGVVGKRLGSIYEPGERSGAWIKFRANMEQEFVIGGYIPGVRGFDALLVGAYESKQLMFAAKVKNGFVPGIRDKLFPPLKALQTSGCPFKNLPEQRTSRWGESLTAEKMDQCR